MSASDTQAMIAKLFTRQPRCFGARVLILLRSVVGIGNLDLPGVQIVAGEPERTPGDRFAQSAWELSV